MGKKLKIKLSGEDGNAFAILGRCVQALRRSGETTKNIEEFKKEATSGDYNNLLQIVMKKFDCS